VYRRDGSWSSATIEGYDEDGNLQVVFSDGCTKNIPKDKCKVGSAASWIRPPGAGSNSGMATSKGAADPNSSAMSICSEGGRAEVPHRSKGEVAAVELLAAVKQRCHTMPKWSNIAAAALSDGVEEAYGMWASVCPEAQAILEQVPIMKQIIQVTLSIYAKHKSLKKVEDQATDTLETTIWFAMRLPILPNALDRELLQKKLENIKKNLADVGNPANWCSPEDAVKGLKEAREELIQATSMVTLALTADRAVDLGLTPVKLATPAKHQKTEGARHDPWSTKEAHCSSTVHKKIEVYRRDGSWSSATIRGYDEDGNLDVVFGDGCTKKIPKDKCKNGSEESWIRPPQVGGHR
jgi:hypothetical protein